MAHVAAIFSLIQEEARRIPGPEIDPEFQMSLGSDCPQIFTGGTKYETRRFALFTFARDEPCENASELEPHRAGPWLQFYEKSLAGQHSFERDEDVAPETFHPAIFHGAETVGVRSFCLKIPKQHSINPPECHFFLPLPMHTLNRYRVTDRLPPEPGLLHCRILKHRRAHRDAAELTYGSNYRSRSGEHFQSRPWI